jgi:hypothetical protein
LTWDLLGAIALGTAAPDRLTAELRGPRGPDVAALAIRHGLAAQVLVVVPDPAALPPAVLEPLTTTRLQTIERHLRALLDLRMLDTVLDAAGIPWLAVKGVVLAETLYPSIELRPHADLDVLVTPEDLGDALDALEAAGAYLVDRNWIAVRERAAGQLHLELPGGTLCDLHWDLTHHPEVRRCFRLPAADVLARSVEVAVGGRSIRTTEPVDTLLHLATHACVSGLSRAMWLADIDRLLRTDPPDWDVVVSRARESGTQLAVAVTLRCARTILSTPIPAGALRHLDRLGLWSRLAGAAARRGAPGGGSDRPGALELVARSTRDTTRRSLLDLARRVIGAGVERLRGHRPPTGAELVMRPTGSAADRSAFLAEVRTQGTGAPAFRS